MRHLILVIFLTVYFNSFGQVTVTIISYLDASCNGACDGSATANATGGTSPYTYQWNNAILQTTPTAVGLCAGIYTIVATDSLGLSDTAFVTILEPSLHTITMTTTNDTCGLCTGSANALVSGGTPPYTYTWSPSGNTTQLVTGLCSGIYTISVMDANGCLSNGADTINLVAGSSCGYGTINGTVYKDDNSNCIKDGLEVGLENITIQAMPGPYFASTDLSGAYSLVAPFGNYTITQVAQPYYNEICPVAGFYAVILDSTNNTLNNNDFGDTITPVQEVSISLLSGTPRPGFSFSYYLNYTSTSNSPMSGTVYLVADDTLTYLSATVTPDNISGDTLFWNYTNLQQFENRHINISFQMPNQVGLLGDSLTACAQISPLAGDVDPSNNTSCITRTIVGSYDPNDKKVVPAGVGPTGDILLSQTELTYTIRFQNSGTFMATNVVVIDTLSANLDVTSLRNLSGSHPFTYDISGQGVLTFNFNNIMLPDSNSNEPNSHGQIQFTLDQDPSNGIGTVIENTAGIYFDFNPAIVTNTVTNTIVVVTDISENIASINKVNVYPNPSNGMFSITFELEEMEEVSIKVFDLLGKKVKGFTKQKLNVGSHKKEWNMSSMNAGIYFMSIKIGTESYLKKIVIQ